jgi:hypothetical protein
MYSDCINYEMTNTDSIGSYPAGIPFYYTNCDNIGVTSSVTYPNTTIFCGKPGSFYTGSLPPMSLAYSFTLATSSVCSNKCTYITNIATDPGYYSINYQKCNGDSVLITGSDLGISIPINDCIRYNTLLTTNILSVITGSESCGFYESLAEYTGSRQYAEIQDYNYNRTSAVHSKYAGAVYTQSNNVYEDWDFKATYNPRDYYVDFTGLFTEIQSSSYDPSQMVVKLPYLANISGGIQELNLQNDNWVYFQTMYRAGSNVTLKQFNSTQYSNQKYLDKTFKVVESGYSYQPYWYRKAGESHECYDVTLLAPSFSSGSLALYTRGFNPSDRVPEHQIRPSGSFPGYTPNDSFSTVRSGSAISASWYWYNVSTDFGTSPTYPLAYNIISDEYNLLTSYFSGSSFTRLTGSYYTAPYTANYNIVSSFGVDFVNRESPRLSANFKIKMQLLKNASTASGFLEGEEIASNTVTIDGPTYIIPAGTSFSTSGNVSANSVRLNSNDKIYVKISLQAGFDDIDVYGINNYFRAEMLPFKGAFCINPSDVSSTLFNTSSFIAGSNILTITEDMNRYFSEDVTYMPSYSTGSIVESPIYSTFGEVNYGTKIEEGDFIYLYYNGSTTGYSDAGISTPILRRITSVTTGSTTSTSSFTVYPELPGYINSSNLNTYDKLIFTKRVPDETTMILQGKKNPGKTSYGFAIPENINPTILKNANTLQSTIQSQILNF